MGKNYIYNNFQIEEYMVKFLESCLFNNFDDKQGENKKEIIFLGDSIIRDYDLNYFFPNIKDKLFNCGVSGITTEGLFNILKNGVVRHNPKIVVILVGTNDMNEYSNRRNEEIVLNIANIITQLKILLNDLNIVVLSILPCDEKRYGKEAINGGSRENSRIIEINKYLKQFENHFKKLKFIDVFPTLADKNNNMVNAYTHDGIHLNVKGYEKMTALVRPVIDEILKKEEMSKKQEMFKKDETSQKDEMPKKD